MFKIEEIHASGPKLGSRKVAHLDQQGKSSVTDLEFKWFVCKMPVNFLGMREKEDRDNTPSLATKEE